MIAILLTLNALSLIIGTTYLLQLRECHTSTKNEQKVKNTGNVGRVGI